MYQHSHPELVSCYLLKMTQTWIPEKFHWHYTDHMVKIRCVLWQCRVLVSGVRTSDNTTSEIKRLLPTAWCEGQERPCPGAPVACVCQIPPTLYLTLENSQIQAVRRAVGRSGVHEWSLGCCSSHCWLFLLVFWPKSRWANGAGWFLERHWPRDGKGWCGCSGRGMQKVPGASSCLHCSVCPNIGITAQGTTMDWVIGTQHFWNNHEVLELLSMCCVNIFL